MPVDVHQEYLQRRYVASWCSVACFVNFLIIVGAGILPLYIAWASHSFWIKDDYRWEQPTLTYKNQFIISMQGMKGVLGSQVPFTLQWSTSPTANDYYGKTLRSPVLKSGTRDNNLDGKPDELHISVSMPLQSDEVITAVTAIAYSDVELKSITRMKMDSLLISQYASATPGTGFTADGDLVFYQRDGIPFAPNGIFMPYLYSGLTALNDATSLQQVDPASIISLYRSRNVTTLLDTPFPLWYSDVDYVPVTPGSLSDLSTASIIPRTFQYNMVARVPQAVVRIRPGISEELKHGWIQYVSFLVITVAVAWILRKIIFGYHVIETSVYVDAPAGKVHAD